MVVYVRDLSAAELAQIEGGSFSWGEVGSPDMFLILRRVRG
jgi:hypothetical protein